MKRRRTILLAMALVVCSCVSFNCLPTGNIGERLADKWLSLKILTEVSDPNLSSIGTASPVAPHFAVITTDGAIRIYDHNGQVIHRLKRRGEVLQSISYSPDGKLLLAGTKTGDIQTWRVQAEKCTVMARHVAESIERVAWLGPDRIVWGRLVEYYGENGTKINRDKASGGVIDRVSGRQSWTYKSFIRDDFQTLAASPDGKRLAILDVPGKPPGAFVLDGSTGNILATLHDSEHGALSACIGPDNNTVAVGCAPYDIILWNADKEAFIKLLKGHSNWVVSLAFSPDGRRLISGAGDGTARIWSVETGKEIGRIRFPDRNRSSVYVHSVGFLPDGKTVFALAEGGKLIIAKAPKPKA